MSGQGLVHGQGLVSRQVWRAGRVWPVGRVLVLGQGLVFGQGLVTGQGLGSCWQASRHSGKNISFPSSVKGTEAVTSGDPPLPVPKLTPCRRAGRRALMLPGLARCGETRGSSEMWY